MSKLFLSCVTREFGSCRNLLTRDLRRAQVEVRVQEEFGVGGSTLLDLLDDYIRQCDAIIHLIGDSTGCFPEVPAVRRLMGRYPDLCERIPGLTDSLSKSDPRLSYTQLEAYLAIYHERKTLIYLPDRKEPRATDVIVSDEERRLQDEHIGRIQALGWQLGTFENEERLSTYVLGDLRQILPSEPESYLAAASRLPKRHDHGVFEGRESALADLNAQWADALAGKTGRAQIISLVAIGGAGKTTLVSRWKDDLLARGEHGGVERYFDWSFYSQGTRHESNNVNAQTAADATVFVAAALKFFGDPAMADSAAPAWDKGARLAMLVAKHRTLLVLDGLESLQHPPGPMQGELKDDALRALLEGLKANGRGLCVVTTRERIQDLEATEITTTPCWQLDHLTDLAGALVLQGHGVIGPVAELQRASAEVKGHALTLSLMGRYLRLAFNPPDIVRRDCFSFSDADAETHNGHAFRVFRAYEGWFEKEDRLVELSILRLLGLFDRPVAPDCLSALCAAPAIPGLTESLVSLGEQQWNVALQRLHELGLIDFVQWDHAEVRGYGEDIAMEATLAGEKSPEFDLGAPQMYRPVTPPTFLLEAVDTHPLLREYFSHQLDLLGAASAGHLRLYEHLCSSVPYWPNGREGLLPLYQAVLHGCKAGRVGEACEDVYLKRIKRGTTGQYANYSSKKLGLLSLDLAAISSFFEMPWRKCRLGLKPPYHAWLLNEAAVRLRALNRLTEAKDAQQAGLEMHVHTEDWRNAAISAINLSEIELALGNVQAADAAANQSIIFADRGDDLHLPMLSRVTRADVIHQAGHLGASRNLFQEAEAKRSTGQLSYPILYSLQGYRYSDLILAEAERTAWKLYLGILSLDSHAACSPLDLCTLECQLREMLKRAISARAAALVDIAMTNLSLGRVHLLRTILESSQAHCNTANTSLEIAIRKLRKSGQLHYLPLALLPCAWLHALKAEWDEAQGRLDEAFSLVTRSGKAQNSWRGCMRLHLADTLLHRARLFGKVKNPSRSITFAGRSKPDEYPWSGRTPSMDLQEAGKLVDACGYHRRDQELQDAKAGLA